MANKQMPTVKAQDVANLPKDEFTFPVQNVIAWWKQF